MKQRFITAVLLGAVFLSLLYLGGWWYSGIMYVLAVIGFIEYAKMNRLEWYQSQVILGLVMVTSFFTINLTELGQEGFFITNGDLILWGLILYLIFMVLSRNHFDIYQVAYLFVGAIYLGYGFSYIGFVRMNSGMEGMLLTLLVVFSIWANDVGAYFIGKRWGNKKMWPDISPNKTIEGALAGLLFSITVSTVFLVLFPHLGKVIFPHLILPFYVKGIVLGVLVGLIGQVGDLVESAIKRTTGVKDSGSILPGHGGILDRFDSLLFTFILLHLVAWV
ncbi:phosphatidate cytidylyltransferase [Hazenella sp. IB182353]|uniref:phosphatidate cytidylyltransferase n=1 Tax=Polycladospora coralii TaxID=2771432 RepID=UPI001746FF21|nr:phosphatidate cytidylyltransferase [Polycladospora coralii]MBS7530445.1 phosphatidate cytidylyltransferase [Polycladospora coralii]